MTPCCKLAPMSTPSNRLILRARRLAYSAAIAAMAWSLILILAKGWAWLHSDSTAMLGLMVDSAMDLLVSTTNFLALRYAFRPADDDHRHGHGKAEGVAALAQAAIIGGAATFVFLEAVRNIFTPVEIQSINASVIVLLVASVGTYALTRYQFFVTKNTGSLAIEADSAHYTSDIIANGGIILSLLIVSQTGWTWFDPLAGMAVAAWLMWQARDISVKALAMLLDREIEDDTRQTVLTLINTAHGIESMHDLRMTKSGTQLMVSFDVEVDPHLTVAASHDIIRKLEQSIIRATRREYTRTEVMIHVDPLGDITDSRHNKLKDYHAR